MKKLSFLLFFALLATITTAQVTIRPHVGINSSDLSEDFEDFKVKSQTGYQVGVDFQFGSRKLYFQPGIQYEFIKNELQAEVTDIKSDLERSGIRVPVMLGYRFGQDADQILNFRVFTGPNFFFQTSTDTDESQFNIDKDDFNDFVMGWNAGLGVDLLFLFIDVGYEFGISEIVDNADTAPRNNLFYGNVGLRVSF